MASVSCGVSGSAAGDLDALCREHLPVVHHEVRSLSARLPSHVAVDDLVSAGMEALAAAARSFEVERGVPFGRYAARRIRGALLDELRSLDWAARSLRARARERQAAREALSGTLRREPDERELAARMGVSRQELRDLDRDLHRSVVLRLDALEDDGADTLLPRQHQTPEAAVIAGERQAYLVAAVESLPDRFRLVVRGTFFEERPLKELAEDLGVTESRISQMRTEALSMLRDGLNAHLDPDRLAPVREGVVARRRAAYHAQIAARAHYPRTPSPAPPARQPSRARDRDSSAGVPASPEPVVAAAPSWMSSR